MTYVAQWLKEVGITPAQLSDKIGLPRGQISRLIVGEEEPDKVTKWALAGLREDLLRDPVHRSPEPPQEMPQNELAKELADGTWTGETARLALPILVDTAINKKTTLTYTELHDAVVDRGGRSDIGKMTKYSFPLGRMAEAMNRLRLPPLTTIVVSASTGLPSSGIDRFIKDYLELTRAESDALKTDPAFRRSKVEQLWNEVWAYEKWLEVMVQLGITGDPKYDR